MIANRSMPQSTVIPVLPYADLTTAIDWLSAAFGFTLRLRIGEHRAQLNAGDGAVVLVHNPSYSPGPPTGASIMIRVDDAEAHYAQAVQHGARVINELRDHPYGERQYSVRDLAEYTWTFSQSIADINPTDWGGIPGIL